MNTMSLKMSHSFISAIVCVTLVFMGTSCNENTSAQQETDPASVRSELLPTEVNTVTAAVSTFEYLIHGNGKIEAAEENWLLWQSSGQLAQLLVRNGDIVKPGQLLAKLHTEQLQLAYEKALVQQKERKLEYENQLLGFKNASATVHENLRYSSGLAAAELSLKEAEYALRQAEIRAGMQGLISDLQMKQGALVNAGDKFCLLHNPTKLMVQMPVIESEVAALRPGLQADVSILADAAMQAKGSIAEINPRVDEKTGMINLRIMLNQTQGLMPGMNARVTLRIPYQENIIVPKEAVVLRSGRQVVFTFENNLAKWNYVQTGRDNGREVEILEGLKPGMQVITTNNLQLAHDAAVSIATVLENN